MKPLTLLQLLPDGEFIDWGRNVTVNGVRGYGGARHYSGEAAEVMELVLKHQKEAGDER
jgi:hypothetical protein